MITRYKKYEMQNGKPVPIGCDFVEFIEITGKESAIIKDKQGKKRRVLRKSLLDVPHYILYPNVVRKDFVPADWRQFTYFN